MTETEFEKSFDKAIKLSFSKTNDYSKEPPVIAIIFSNEKDGINGYQFLQNEFTKEEISIVFRLAENGKINLSIIDNKNSKVFNIYNLDYSKTEMADFRENGQFGKYCVFCISQIINNQLVLSSIVREKPLMVSELVFSEWGINLTFVFLESDQTKRPFNFNFDIIKDINIFHLNGGKTKPNIEINIKPNAQQRFGTIGVLGEL